MMRRAQRWDHFDGGALRLDGAALRDQIIDELRAVITTAGSPTVVLATVVVGDDDASARYVGLKHRAAERTGITPRGTTLPPDSSQAEVEEAVDRLNDDPEVHGILVQLPLPEGLDEASVLDRIDPARDVDGLTLTNLGRLLRGAPGLVPPTPLAVLHLLDAYEIGVRGADVVIIGRTPLVGIPLSLLLATEERGATVQLCAPGTAGLDLRCRAADVVISDASVPHLVGPDWIGPGATVIDIGVSRPGGTLIGDVDTVGVAGIAGALAPNPGGIGPMTVACLLENTVIAAGLARDPNRTGA
jgi:methylenetetrahydrofolate dehydrogenase (NADP+)/methenyltetrahydrofolate cyclohydrolase